MLQVSVFHRSSCQVPRGYGPVPEMHRGSMVTGFVPRGERFALTATGPGYLAVLKNNKEPFLW
jgi:hypothetical protein